MYETGRKASGLHSHAKRGNEINEIRIAGDMCMGRDAKRPICIPTQSVGTRSNEIKLSEALSK